MDTDRRSAHESSFVGNKSVEGGGGNGHGGWMSTSRHEHSDRPGGSSSCRRDDIPPDVRPSRLAVVSSEFENDDCEGIVLDEAPLFEDVYPAEELAKATLTERDLDKMKRHHERAVEPDVFAVASQVDTRTMMKFGVIEMELHNLKSSIESLNRVCGRRIANTRQFIYLNMHSNSKSNCTAWPCESRQFCQVYARNEVKGQRIQTRSFDRK